MAQAAAPLHLSATLHCAPGLLPAFLQLHLLGRGALTWHPALASVQVCFVEGWLCLALCSCMQLVSLPHTQAPGQGWGSGLLRARGCSEANTAAFSLAGKSINLQTV